MNPATPVQHPLRKWAFLVTIGVSLLWGIGQIVRDRTWLNGLCFYIPSVIVAAVWLVWAIVYTRSRRGRFVLLSMAFSLPPLVMVLAVENRLFAPKNVANGASVRLVHWNIAGRLRPKARAALLDQNADLYVLSEIRDRNEVEEFCTSCGADYSFAVSNNLAVVARGEIALTGRLTRRPKLQAFMATCALKTKTVNVLVVDVPSWIQIPRDPMLEEINQLIETRQPEVVVGDFNAPRRSRQLANLPAGYRHAYETVGTGWGYTWPVPIPVYSLDHCLYSPKIEASHYELISTWASDHRFQVFDFR